MRFVTLMVAVMLALAPADADACDRQLSPFETAEVGAAVADIVIVGEVIAVHDDRVVTVKSVSTLKGTAPPQVQIRGVTTLDEVDRCSGVPIELGKKYVFLLWSPAGQLTAYHLVDENGGVADATPANEKKFREAVAKGHPRSPWQVKGDIATMLVREPAPANADDVDVLVVMRNIGAKPKTYRFAAWPRQTQTKCVLSIVNVETKKRVAAKQVPIAQKDISTYFSKNDRKWETKIAAGEAQQLRLFRITTAKSGWGYKEELGFVYYPVDKPGAHEVSAECANVFGLGTRAVTAAVTLTL